MLDPVIDRPDHEKLLRGRPAGREEESTPGVLARRFVGILLKNAHKGRKTEERIVGAWRHLPDFEDLDADEGEEPEEVGSVTLAVDEAAAAILLADCLEAEPAITGSFRSGSPVVVVQAPDARSRPWMDHVLKVCVLGRSTPVLTERQLDSMLLSPRVLKRRHAVIMDCDVEKREREKLDERGMTALSLGLPVCVVSTDVGRNVPARIRSAADLAIFPGGWKASSLSLMIEAVTGDSVIVSEESWLASVTLDDLRMSVSSQRGGEESLARLRVVATTRRAQEAEVPELISLSGYGDARRVGLEMVQDLHDLREGRIGWADVGRGLVLAGPPGVGKTFYARSFAKSADLPLVIASLAQWQASGDGHLGDCLKAMKLSFAEARACAPSVLFIDELDSLGDRATFHHQHRDYSSQVVNALLEELDGAADRTGVVVLGATNHPDRIDPAILRAGRLDRLVHIGLPDTVDLMGILRTQLGPELPFADLRPAALAARGGTGADAASWVRRARGVARRAGRDLDMQDLLDAVMEGRERLAVGLRERVALHEAAHACAVIALGVGSVHGISILDNGGITVVEHGQMLVTRDDAVGMIVHSLAGRAAEIAFFGAASSGAGGDASSDLARATRVAFAIEGSWGLGEAGPIWIGDAQDVSAVMRVSALVEPVRRLLLHGETEALRLVEANREAIRRCADRLLETWHMDADMVARALGPIPHFTVATLVAERGPPKRDGSASRT